MANDYFNGGTSLTRYTLARAEVVNANFAAIAAGFDLLPSRSLVLQDKIIYGVASGTVTLEASIQTAFITALTAGLHIRLKMPNGLTATAATLNLNGLGAASIKRPGGSALVAGDWVASSFADFVYDTAGTYWQNTGPLLGDMSVILSAVSDATAALACANAALNCANNAVTLAGAVLGSATAALACANAAVACADAAVQCANNAAAAAIAAAAAEDTITFDVLGAAGVSAGAVAFHQVGTNSYFTGSFSTATDTVTIGAKGDTDTAITTGAVKFLGKDTAGNRGEYTLSAYLPVVTNPGTVELVNTAQTAAATAINITGLNSATHRFVEATIINPIPAATNVKLNILQRNSAGIYGDFDWKRRTVELTAGGGTGSVATVMQNHANLGAASLIKITLPLMPGALGKAEIWYLATDGTSIAERCEFLTRAGEDVTGFRLRNENTSTTFSATVIHVQGVPV